jgi:hypothetical protein
VPLLFNANGNQSAHWKSLFALRVSFEKSRGAAKIDYAETSRTSKKSSE